MAKLSERQREFLRNPYFGVVTTLREDGSPHNTVVWVDVDDEAVISTPPRDVLSPSICAAMAARL